MGVYTELFTGSPASSMRGLRAIFLEEYSRKEIRLSPDTSYSGQ